MSQDTKITIEQLRHIAKLSRLEISPEQEQILLQQLSQTTSYIDILNELDVSNVKPTSEVNHKSTVLRDDTVGDSLSQQDALSQAPEVHNGYFKTSATIKK